MSEPQQRSSFWATILAVFWAFFGVRRGTDYQRDIQQLKPRQLIIAGLIGGVLFVVAIIVFVRFVVAHVQP